MAQCGKAGKDWLAPVLFTGTCDHKIVEHWLEHCLFKELTKPSLIIADNAPFHRKTYLTELAKQHASALQIKLYLRYAPQVPSLYVLVRCST